MARTSATALLLDSHELRIICRYIWSICAACRRGSAWRLRDVAPISVCSRAALRQRESRYAVLFELLLKLAYSGRHAEGGEKIATKRATIRRSVERLKKNRSNSLRQGCGESEISLTSVVLRAWPQI
ncbi:hypothetical protein LAD54_21830 [Klebsiella pneumoniae]|nr:hypothetical protein [Klebsiella pneumoniae]